MPNITTNHAITDTNFSRVNIIEAVHVWKVARKRKSWARFNFYVYARPTDLRGCVRTEKLRDSGNPPLSWICYLTRNYAIPQVCAKLFSLFTFTDHLILAETNRFNFKYWVY